MSATEGSSWAAGSLALFQSSAAATMVVNDSSAKVICVVTRTILSNAWQADDFPASEWTRQRSAGLECSVAPCLCEAGIRRKNVLKGDGKEMVNCLNERT